MQNRLLRLCVATVAVAGFYAHVPRASAELLTLNYQGQTTNPGNPTLAVTVNGTTFSNASIAPFYWTQNAVPPNQSFPPPISTYCIELNSNQPLPPVGTNTVFSVVSANSALGGATASAVGELYARYYQTAWADQSTFHGSVDSAAFQLAMWELVYDAAGKDLNSGNFQASGLGNYTTTAQNMLNSLNGSVSFSDRFGNSELVALLAPATTDPNKSQDQIQDQIIIRPKPVPAPPALMLAGIGVLGLVGRARWNRRKAA